MLLTIILELAKAVFILLLHRDIKMTSGEPSCSDSELISERYIPHSDTLSWDAARQFCTSHGLWDLSVISSEEEFTYLKDTIIENPAYTNQFWVGLSDSEQEGIFRWITPDHTVEERPSHKWHQNYPLCKAGANCVTIYHTGGTHPQLLLEKSCSFASAFICEDDKIPCDIPPPTSKVPKCVNSRYHFISQLVTWQAARDYCVNRMSADLITIETYNEFLYIRNKAIPTEKNWWVGLSRLRTFAECQQPLGMESGAIPDSSLSASTYFTFEGIPREPKYARLNHPTNTWASDTGDDTPWIEVDLGEEKGVVGLRVQGWTIHWIEELKISTRSISSAPFEYVSDESNNPKIFTAVSNPSEIRTINFTNYTLMARYIRLEPIKQSCVANSGPSNYCCLRFEVIGCDNYDVCNDALGMENGSILDNQLSSSSIFGGDTKPENSRLNNQLTRATDGRTPCWIAGSQNANQWIQVDLLQPTKVAGVILQGRGSGDGVQYMQYVTEFKVSYSLATSWGFVKNSLDQDAVFVGNTDQDTPVTRNFYKPISTRLIRVNPTAWNNFIAVRLEILGIKDDWHWVSSADITESALQSNFLRWAYHRPLVDPDRNCVAMIRHTFSNYPGLSGLIGYAEIYCDEEKQFVCETTSCSCRLGMEDGRITDDQITASSEWDSNHRTQSARLNLSTPSGADAWNPLSADTNAWIQVKFESSRQSSTLINGVILQGRADYPQWVTEYKVRYSYDGDNWRYVKTANNQDEQVFVGVNDQTTPVTSIFPRPIRQAVYVRLYPTAFYNHISLRFELLGCQDDEVSFKVSLNHRLIGHILSTIYVRSLSECVVKCLSEPACESVNIHGDDVKALGNRICELNSASKSTNPSELIAHTGIAYAGL